MEHTDKSKHTGIDCPVCNREFFVGDIINTANINKINSHDGLVEACKALVNSHGMHGPCEQNSCLSCRAAYVKGKQALKAVNLDDADLCGRMAKGDPETV